MIRLKNLMMEIEENSNDNIAFIENDREWKVADVDHLLNMKFQREGDKVFVLSNPAMKIYKIKRGPFIVEEPIENYDRPDNPASEQPTKPIGLSAFTGSRKIIKREFSSFIKLIRFFDSYKQ